MHVLLLAVAHWQEVDDLYARAISYFKDSAMIHVFAAQYYNIYRGNHRIEQMHLTDAEVGRDMDWRCIVSVCAPRVLWAGRSSQSLVSTNGRGELGW